MGVRRCVCGCREKCGRLVGVGRRGIGEDLGSGSGRAPFIGCGRHGFWQAH